MKSKTEHGTEPLQAPPWMEPHRKAYVEKLVVVGYSDGQRRKHERTVNRFCAALGACEPDDAVTIEACCNVAICNGSTGPDKSTEYDGAKYKLKCFMDYLLDLGAISPPEPPAKSLSVMDDCRY